MIGKILEIKEFTNEVNIDDILLFHIYEVKTQFNDWRFKRFVIESEKELSEKEIKEVIYDYDFLLRDLKEDDVIIVCESFGSFDEIVKQFNDYKFIMKIRKNNKFIGIIR